MIMDAESSSAPPPPASQCRDFPSFSSGECDNVAHALPPGGGPRHPEKRPTRPSAAARRTPPRHGACPSSPPPPPAAGGRIANQRRDYWPGEAMPSANENYRRVVSTRSISGGRRSRDSNNNSADGDGDDDDGHSCSRVATLSFLLLAGIAILHAIATGIDGMHDDPKRQRQPPATQQREDFSDDVNQMANNEIEYDNRSVNANGDPRSPDDSSGDEPAATILSRSSQLSSLISNLDASDVVECYVVTRMAHLTNVHSSFSGGSSKKHRRRLGRMLDESVSSADSDDDEKSSSTTSSTPSGPVQIRKSALAFRYRPHSSSAHSTQFTDSEISPNDRLERQKYFELTLEYGPQRTGAARTSESMPMVHVDMELINDNNDNSYNDDYYGKYVSWENEGRVYHSTSISSEWTEAYYMSAITGVVFEKVVQRAVEYSRRRPRYQPFEVVSIPSGNLILRSSGSDDFVWDMMRDMAELYVDIDPILVPPRGKVQFYVADPPDEARDEDGGGGRRAEGHDDISANRNSRRKGRPNPNVRQVKGPREGSRAAAFYERFFGCANAIRTGDYSAFVPPPSVAPTASPTITMAPSAAPTYMETMAPSSAPTATEAMAPSASPTATETMAPSASPTDEKAPTTAPTAAMSDGKAANETLVEEDVGEDDDEDDEGNDGGVSGAEIPDLAAREPDSEDDDDAGSKQNHTSKETGTLLEEEGKGASEEDDDGRASGDEIPDLAPLEPGDGDDDDANDGQNYTMDEAEHGLVHVKSNQTNAFQWRKLSKDEDDSPVEGEGAEGAAAPETSGLGQGWEDISEGDDDAGEKDDEHITGLSLSEDVPPEDSSETSSEDDPAEAAEKAAIEAAEKAEKAAAVVATNTSSAADTAAAMSEASIAAARAKDASVAARSKSSAEALLSGDGELMTSVLSNCFSDPKYGIRTQEEVRVDRSDQVEGGDEGEGHVVVRRDATYAYIYLDGDSFVRLNLTSPYWGTASASGAAPPHGLRPEGKGDAVDWAIFLLILAGTLFGFLVTAHQVGLVIDKRLKFRWFFHPTAEGEEEDEYALECQRSPLQKQGGGFLHSELGMSVEAIPTSMGGEEAKTPPPVYRDDLGSNSLVRSDHSIGGIDLEMAERRGANGSGGSSTRPAKAAPTRASFGDEGKEGVLPDSLRMKRDTPDLVERPSLKSMSKIALPKQSPTMEESSYCRKLKYDGARAGLKLPLEDS